MSNSWIGRGVCIDKAQIVWNVAEMYCPVVPAQLIALWCVTLRIRKDLETVQAEVRARLFNELDEASV